MKKKILLFVLAFAMILTSLSTFVFADDEPAGGEEPEGFVCTCPSCSGEEAGLRSDAEITACQGEKYLNIAPSSKIVEIQNTHWHFSSGISPINRLTDGDWHYGVLSPSGTPWEKFSMAFEEDNCVDKIVLVLDNWGQGTNSGGHTYTPTATNLDDRNGNSYTMKVSLYTWDETAGAEVQYGTTTEYTIDKTTPVLEIEVPDLNLTKITFDYGRNSEWVINKVIWEIEVWSNQTFHKWNLDTDAIVTPATCTTDGVGGYKCNCGATFENATIPATGHNPSGEWVIEPAVPGVPAVEDDPATPEDETAAEVPAVPEKCYQTCANNGCSEKLDYGEHSYSSNCDTKCNKCSTVRSTTEAHFYVADCQENCTACGEAREPIAEHTFDQACDTTCDLCLATREVEGHVYTDCADTECDSVNAEDPTKKCGFVRTDAPGHTWDNACDNECNVCGAANPDYAPGHGYANDCDADCEICGALRTVEHQYDNACDTTCNVCGVTREVGAHVYDNACDNACNNCGAANPNFADHVYDNNCDNECNVCGAANANFADHVYGEDFEKSEDGFKVFTCTVCGYKNVTTEKAGLGGGAIAGIVIGSIAVVAIAAYAAYYFLVVKKKG